MGANLHPSKVVIIGIGNLLADAISMGFGEYVSSAAEEDFIKSERLREEWYATINSITEIFVALTVKNIYF